MNAICAFSWRFDTSSIENEKSQKLEAKIYDDAGKSTTITKNFVVRIQPYQYSLSLKDQIDGIPSPAENLSAVLKVDNTWDSIPIDRGEVTFQVSQNFGNPGVAIPQTLTIPVPKVNGGESWQLSANTFVFAIAQNASPGSWFQYDAKVKLFKSGTVSESLTTNIIYIAAPPSCSNKVPYENGDGSLSKPFVICSSSQLKYLSENEKDWNKNFILAASIEMNTVPFKPIGNFSGTFNGQGYPIYNLTPTFNQNTDQGLFGISVGSVNNVVLVNPRITSLNSAGALAGVMAGTGRGNLLFGGSVAGSACTGGLVGKLKWNVDFQYNKSVRTRVITQGARSAGGLIGCYDSDGATTPASVKLHFNHADSQTEGGADVGGLIGSLGITRPTIASIDLAFSSATGAVSASKTGTYYGGAGGLVGAVLADAVQIRESFANVLVNGSMVSGGLVGNLEKGSVSNCYSLGDVTYIGSLDYRAIPNIGGLVGRSYVGSVEYSFSLGNIVASTSGSLAGSLVGYSGNGSIKYSRALGTCQSCAGQPNIFNVHDLSASNVVDVTAELPKFPTFSDTKWKLPALPMTRAPLLLRWEP